MGPGGDCTAGFPLPSSLAAEPEPRCQEAPSPPPNARRLLPPCPLVGCSPGFRGWSRRRRRAWEGSQ
ncbi:Hypothetical predicted protein [Podarcis lilfordi]|uniref:Uncharacterized protein n=1 Tax=Podarcis lilfordi TaxID=74358 RepID=A0AA35KKU0_9SAUR|nr:Hypothetical predicted protein [Podarcis lilfordi]